MADLLPGEEINEGQTLSEVDKVRRIVADVYTFVRSQEVNRTIGGFTFDHYIDEAKRRIQGSGRAIRDASGSAFDVRPTKLDALDSLESEFRASFEVINTLAKAAQTASDDEASDE